MSGTKWTTAELKKLRKIARNKPQFTTDTQLAGLLSRQFGKSSESIRWQLRQFHQDVATKKPPKILLIDIETLPIVAEVWDVWKQTIYPEQIRLDWSILCWSAKWLFSDKVMGAVVTPQEAIAHEDRSILMRAWELMNEADLVITHNGDNFDIKKLNARFFQNGYPKPMYFQSIDTKKVAIDNFSFTYNKLDWIAQIIGVGRKIETEYLWWKECGQGNKKYLAKMLEYNMHDVNLEEEVYLRLRPWMTKHPNVNVHAIGSNVVACPACGSSNIHWNGTYSTALGLYQAFRCEDCSAIGRSTKKAYKIGSSAVQN